MRYAIISDIHANESALRAVLNDAADAHAEKIVCLGDVLGYGPEPVQTLELVYRRVHVCLAGNHDDAVAGNFPTQDFTQFAEAAVKRHRAALSGEAIKWLRRLPHVCEFPAIHEGLEGAFACTHGDFDNPEKFNYVLDPEDAMPSWTARKEQLLFVGHTHKPGIYLLGPSGQPHYLEPSDFVLEPGKRYLVNVGSVGYPRNGICRSFYCIYDNLSRAVFFRSLPFDLESYSAKMHGQGLDEAPWMKKREKERRPVEVRGEAHFGKTGSTAKTPVVVLKRLAPKKVEPEAKSEPIAQPTVRLRVPEGVKTPPPLVETPAKSRNGLVPAMVVGAVVVLGLGVLLACALSRTTADRRNRAPGAASVKMSEPPKLPVDQRFRELQRLTEEWSATFEQPATQKVTVGENVRHEPITFQLESTQLGTIRLMKRLNFINPPERIYWTVALLPGTGSGPNSWFSFNAVIKFYNVRGQLLDQMNHSAKRSATNRPVAVPPGTTSAVMEVDCRLQGAYEMSIPHFKTTSDDRRNK